MTAASTAILQTAMPNILTHLTIVCSCVDFLFFLITQQITEISEETILCCGLINCKPFLKIRSLKVIQLTANIYWYIYFSLSISCKTCHTAIILQWPKQPYDILCRAVRPNRTGKGKQRAIWFTEVHVHKTQFISIPDCQPQNVCWNNTRLLICLNF